MGTPSDNSLTRRELLQATGKVAAAGALAGVLIPPVYAYGDETIQLALVGCGGRGTGAAANALSSVCGPTKLVAMADVMPEKLKQSYEGLKGQFEKQMDVPEDRKFIGFDGYKKAMDALKPGDVVMLTTPPAFRWVQFAYAIERGLNVFMEKPVTVDGPSTRKMLALAKKAEEKNLKVGVGLMCRHCAARGELFDRVQNGEVGDVLLLRAYRMAGPTAKEAAEPRPKDQSELMYQIQWFHSFLWASGGGYSDFLIHNIDECCWMKNDWPVQAQSSGGRHYRGDRVDQNFDSYSTEFTFKDGTKMYLEGRTIAGCHQEFATYLHGSKGSAIVSQAGHMPSRARIFKGQKFDNNEIVWKYAEKEPNPYQLEWDHLLDAIRQGKTYNEVERGAKSSLVTAMGRMAAHTGQIITYDQILNHEHEFAPGLETLTLDGPAPLLADADGKYPVPMPGIKTKREY